MNKVKEAAQKLRSYYTDVNISHVKGTLSAVFKDKDDCAVCIKAEKEKDGIWYSRVSGDPLAAHKAITIILHEMNPLTTIFEYES
jgi:hypothetical protein